RSATTVTIDPARSKGPLDLPEVIRYANSKNIKILLYVNRRALEKQLDELLPLYREWGIAGIKFGFVQVGTQEATQWLNGFRSDVCKISLPTRRFSFNSSVRLQRRIQS
ncbi:MAG: glycoside hydrolase family 97 catalytic domain-containing protein, partial [Bacteroidales bacterium]|nr:glycoside hydrolase family 97 catalytic domain-containing protein [Bacteroidales bacterium]